MALNKLFSAFLIQVFFALHAFAAPIAQSTEKDNAWEFGTTHGLLGLAVLILDIIVFVEVLKSNRSPCSKLLWCLVVFIFPLVGMLFYWLFSNRAYHNNSSGYEPVS